MQFLFNSNFEQRVFVEFKRLEDKLDRVEGRVERLEQIVGKVEQKLEMVDNKFYTYQKASDNLVRFATTVIIGAAGLVSP